MGSTSKRGQVPKGSRATETPPPHIWNSEIAQLQHHHSKRSFSGYFLPNLIRFSLICNLQHRLTLSSSWPYRQRLTSEFRLHPPLADTSTLSKRQHTHPTEPSVCVLDDKSLRYKHNNGWPTPCESQERPLRRHVDPHRYQQSQIGAHVESCICICAQNKKRRR